MTAWRATSKGFAAHWVDGINSLCGNVVTATWGEAPDDLHRCVTCQRLLDRPIGAFLDASGLTYRMLDLWTRHEYIHPDPRRVGATSGTPRTWPEAELDIARYMARLVFAGVNPGAAARAARADGVLAPGVRVVLGEAS